MNHIIKVAPLLLAVLLGTAPVLAAQAPLDGRLHVAQRMLGGTGAPQAVACAQAGGTEEGNMCKLPSGDSCQSMAFARDGVCLDAEGNLPDPEELIDYGTNDGLNGNAYESSGDSGDSGSSE